MADFQAPHRLDRPIESRFAMARITRGYVSMIAVAAIVFQGISASKPDPLFPPSGIDPLVNVVATLVIAAVLSVVVIVPFGPFIYVSERWRLRSCAFHATAGLLASLAIDLIGLIPQASDKWQRPSVEDYIVLTIPIVIAGTLGAVAYWLVAGRLAGETLAEAEHRRAFRTASFRVDSGS